MSALRLYKAGLAGESQVKLRVYDVELAALVPVQPKLRVYEAELATVGAVIVSLPAAVIMGPGEQVELDAVLVTGGSATWAWRRISGPSLPIATDGGSATLTGPSRWNADVEKPLSGAPGISTIVVGVTATVGGVTSPEARCTVTVLPQLSWARSDGTYVGARVAPA